MLVHFYLLREEQSWQLFKRDTSFRILSFGLLKQI